MEKEENCHSCMHWELCGEDKPQPGGEVAPLGICHKMNIVTWWKYSCDQWMEKEEQHDA